MDLFRSVVMVSFYFDKKRAIANGMSHALSVEGFLSNEIFDV